MTTRAETIDLLWELRPQLLFVTKEQFAAALDGWEIDPREVDGEVAFIFLTKGPELHFTTLGTGRPMPKAMARDVLQRIIDREGYVIVKTPKHEKRQQRFNRAIGFREIGEDEYDVHMRLERFGRAAQNDERGRDVSRPRVAMSAVFNSLPKELSPYSSSERDGPCQ